MIKVVIIFLYTNILYSYLSYKKCIKTNRGNLNNQAKFIQDASHELRTPITIVSSKLEGLF